MNILYAKNIILCVIGFYILYKIISNISFLINDEICSDQSGMFFIFGDLSIYFIILMIENNTKKLLKYFNRQSKFLKLFCSFIYLFIGLSLLDTNIGYAFQRCKSQCNTLITFMFFGVFDFLFTSYTQCIRINTHFNILTLICTILISFIFIKASFRKLDEYKDLDLKLT